MPCFAAAGETYTLSLPASGSLSHVAVDVLEVAYERAGLHAKFKFYAGRESLTASNDGVTDGEVLRIDGLEGIYYNLRKVEPAIFHLRSTAFVRRRSGIVIKSEEDLAPYRVGYLNGVVHAERMAYKGATSVSADSYGEMLRLLDQGEVDVAIFNLTSGTLAINDSAYTSISANGTVLATYPLYHYLHRDHAEIIPQISEQLQIMKTNGEINSIFLRNSKQNLLSQGFSDQQLGN